MKVGLYNDNMGCEDAVYHLKKKGRCNDVRRYLESGQLLDIIQERFKERGHGSCGRKHHPEYLAFLKTNEIACCSPQQVSRKIDAFKIYKHLLNKNFSCFPRAAQQYIALMTNPSGSRNQVRVLDLGFIEKVWSAVIKNTDVINNTAGRTVDDIVRTKYQMLKNNVENPSDDFKLEATMLKQKEKSPASQVKFIITRHFVDQRDAIKPVQAKTSGKPERVKNKNFLEDGRYLRQVLEDKSYLNEHDTFDSFTRKEFGFSEQRANRLILTTRLFDDMRNAGVPPHLMPESDWQYQRLMGQTSKLTPFVWGYGKDDDKFNVLSKNAIEIWKDLTKNGTTPTLKQICTYNPLKDIDVDNADSTLAHAGVEKQVDMVDTEKQTDVVVQKKNESSFVTHVKSVLKRYVDVDKQTDVVNIDKSISDDDLIDIITKNYDFIKKFIDKKEMEAQRSKMMLEKIKEEMARLEQEMNHDKIAGIAAILADANKNQQGISNQ